MTATKTTIKGVISNPLLPDAEVEGEVYLNLQDVDGSKLVVFKTEPTHDPKDVALNEQIEMPEPPFKIKTTKEYDGIPEGSCIYVDGAEGGQAVYVGEWSSMAGTIRVKVPINICTIIIE